MLREPSFPEDELEKLKQQTVAAIREQQSDTRWRAYERLTQTLYNSGLSADFAAVLRQKSAVEFFAHTEPIELEVDRNSSPLVLARGLHAFFVERSRTHRALSTRTRASVSSRA